MPERIVEPDYSSLLARLSNPETFDPASMPVGQAYLRSHAKLAFDVLASVGVLPITAIPTLLGAAAIRLIDHEQPVFRQQRIGYQAEPFTVYKLRTMPGAPEHTDSNGRHNDPRRSRLGRILSLLRIDESLQLANVARREMSIIGPRPLLGSILHNAKYLVGPNKADEWEKVRSLALPGIFDDFSNMHHGYKLTGDAAEQLLKRIEVESEYILDKASFHEDLRILGKTVTLLGSTITQHVGAMLGSTGSPRANT